MICVCVLFSFAWDNCLVLCFLGSYVVYFCSVLAICVCVEGGLQGFLGVSLFVFSVLLVCSAGVVEMCFVDGSGFMVWASCQLYCVFSFCKILF